MIIALIKLILFSVENTLKVSSMHWDIKVSKYFKVKKSLLAIFLVA